MTTARTASRGLAAAVFALAMLLGSLPAHGYIRASYSLGRIVSESAYVSVLRVSAVDRSKNFITYQKVRDLKGTFADTVLQHNIGNYGEFSFEGKGTPGANLQNNARDWRDIMDWAGTGKEAVMFCSPNGSQAEICMGNYWYQTWKEGAGWRLVHSEPTFALAFAGRVQNLIVAVQAMQAGQEVVVPCMAPSDAKALIERTARLQRVKASLKLGDYNAQRDFVGWGGDADQLRPVAGMPGFSQYGALASMGSGPVGLAPVCLNGDDKPGLCLFSEQRVVLMENREGFLAECVLGIEGGARAAAWADYNGDGRPDLLLATPSGLLLLANEGGGKFTNRTASLPSVPYQHVTAAVWIRGAPNAQPDILLADGFRGLRLYRNKRAPPSATSATPTNAPPDFEDVSDTVGLGLGGAAGRLKGDHLLVADVNGDGIEDVLFSAGSGVLLLQTQRGFAPAPACGISYRAGGVIPAFGDFSGDGRPDLFVPQTTGPSLLFLNDGAGRFRDATAMAGDLAKPMGHATCAVWSDFCKRGRADLLVGCLRGQNRYFRNNGNGTFTDAGNEIGLYEGIYNTTALCVLDVNQDGVPDLVMGNTGGESAVLVGSRRRIFIAGTAQAGVPARSSEIARKGTEAYASAER